MRNSRESPCKADRAVIVNRPGEADGIVDRIRAAGNVCVKAYEDLSREKLRALREATAKRGMAMPGHVPYGLDYVAGDVPEVTSTLKGDHLIERSFDWSSVDDARLDEVVQATLQNGTINLPTLVSTSQFLYFRDVAAARATPAAHLLPRLYKRRRVGSARRHRHLARGRPAHFPDRRLASEET